MTNPSPTTPAAAPIDELHVHDWSPWGPSPLSESLGIERHRRMCFSCQLYQDEPTPELRETPLGLVPESAISAAADALVGEESGYCGPGYGTCGSLHVSREHAAELARAALAAAVPHIERAIRDKIAAAEALHAPKRLHPEFRFRPWCEECSTGERTFHDDGVFTHRVYWPCRTAQALGMVDPLDPARVARGGEATE